MLYLKTKTKYIIFTLTVIILALTLFLSGLAKTEVYFSLYDRPQEAIIRNIKEAEAFINIAMYIFTDREIAFSLIEAKERGVKVRVYLPFSALPEITTLDLKEWEGEGIKIICE